MLSTAYLSTTTVMQSVATTCSEKTQDIFTPKVCCKADAQILPPTICDGHVHHHIAYPRAMHCSANASPTVQHWTVHSYTVAIKQHQQFAQPKLASRV